ncbi:MAG: hypothetical protein ABSH21_01840 [Verrucomicrobiia bacterium]|jgi:hypothetical protein
MILVEMLGSRLEDVPQNDVHDLGASRSDFAAISACAMRHPQPVFLDLEEFLVEIEDLGGFRSGLQNEPLGGVPADFLQVARLRHAAHDTGQSCGPQVGNTLRKQLAAKLVQRHKNVSFTNLILHFFELLSWHVPPLKEGDRND